MTGKGVKMGPCAVPPARTDPSEEASRLKSLAAEMYASGDIKTAVKHAKRAQMLHPTLDGTTEMLAAYKIIRKAAASFPDGRGEGSENSLIRDYYGILGVEKFSLSDVIKKQFKKLALMLHPDKNPTEAAKVAFKFAAEAAEVLSDRTRRKEYDTALRVAMQSKATAAELTEAEAFWTACSTCRLLHQFERKYLGHNLVCPECKKSFKAIEVADGGTNKNGGSAETVPELEQEQQHQQQQTIGGISEIVREEQPKQPIGGNDGIPQDSPQKEHPIKASDEIVQENPQQQQTRASTRIKEKVERGDGLGIVMRCGLGSKSRRNRKNPSKTVPPIEEVPARATPVEEEGDPVEEVPAITTPIEKDDSLLLPKQIEGNVDADSEEEAMTLSQIRMLVKNKKKRTDEANAGESLKKRGHKDAKERRVDSLKENESQENGQKKPKLMIRKVPRFGVSIPFPMEAQTKKRLMDEEIVPAKKRPLEEEIELVVDGDFHDFDMFKNFKKGQVWAIHNAIDKMPYPYMLFEKVIWRNPFLVKCISLWPLDSAACGRFLVSNQVIQIKSRAVFSHLLACSRAGKDMYEVYPRKNSVWALQKSATDRSMYEIVVCLSTYSESDGVSIAWLEKVPGYRAIFKRVGIGARFVACARKDFLMDRFSHNIPAKKCSGKERPGLPNHCWALDPAGVPTEFLLME